MGATYSAAILARGWLAVAVASGKDAHRPALDRTISIEEHPQGVRLVATDSYVLLRSWVPNLAHTWGPEPDVDEAPRTTAVAADPHGRARGFLGHALTLAKDIGEDDPPIEVRLTLGVIDHDGQGQTLDGMEATSVVLELPEQERLSLATYEGAYPEWRHATSSFAGLDTDRIALNPDIVGRLAKLGRIQKGTSIGWEFGGRGKMARVELIGGEPAVDGWVMPCRWDFDSNAPRTEPAATEPETVAVP